MGIKAVGKKYKGVYFNTLKNGVTVYYLQYRDEIGKVRTKRCDANTKDEAMIMLIEKRAEIKSKKADILQSSKNEIQKKKNRAFTLDEYAKIFHEGRENRDAKAEKAMYYNHISPILGKNKIAKLTKEHILNFRKTLEKKKVKIPKVIHDYDKGTKESIDIEILLSGKTIKNILDYLRVILNNAVDDGYTTHSPLDFSSYKDKNRKALEKKKIYGEVTEKFRIDAENGRVLTDDELEVLWDLDTLNVKERLFLFLKCCYYTGARPDAIISLQVRDINFSTMRIRIKPMKKGRAYEAKVTDMLISLLNKWIEKHDLKHDNFIFFPMQSYMRAKNDEERITLKRKHASYSGYRRALQKIFDPVFNKGIDSYDQMKRVNVYSMRRTAATKVYRKHGIVHAQMFLNHTDIKTTMHYLNINHDMQEIDYGL